MKIAIFADAFLPYIGGVSTTINSQANELAKRGHKIVIFCPNYPGLNKVKKHPNIRIKGLSPYYSTPGYKKFKLVVPTFLSSLETVLKFKPDIIHCHTEAGVGLEGRTCAQVLKIPLITTFHTFIADPGYLKNFKLENSKLVNKTVWKYLINFHNKSKLLTCPTELTRNEIRKNGYKKKIEIIQNGVELERFNKSRLNKKAIAKVKKKFDLTDFTIVNHGRVSIEKSIDVLLRSFKLVLKKFPKTKLLIVGNGPAFKDVKNYTKKLGISKNVIFTGEMSPEQLTNNAILPSCDLFVTASKTETQGLVLIEAMASGLPVIGVKQGGVVNIIDHEKNGYLAKPDNSEEIAGYIVKMIKNKRLREKFSKKCLEDAKAYSITSVCDKLEGIYAKISK